MITSPTGGNRKSKDCGGLGYDTMMDSDESTTVHDMKAIGFRVNNVMDLYMHCFCGHQAISNYSSNRLEFPRVLRSRSRCQVQRSKTYMYLEGSLRSSPVP